MEYYLLSFVISIIIFILIQIYEYNRINNEIQNNQNNYYIEPYEFLSINNAILFIILYIVLTIASYYLNYKSIDLSFISNFIKGGGSSSTSTNNQTNEVNPQVISKITESHKVGFEPYDSNEVDSDNSDDDDDDSDNSDDDNEIDEL